MKKLTKKEKALRLYENHLKQTNNVGKAERESFTRDVIYLLNSLGFKYRYYGDSK